MALQCIDRAALLVELVFERDGSFGLSLFAHEGLAS